MTPYNITDDIIEQVRKADILEVVQSRVQSKLKRSGANYSCCCPLHQESTPSFVINVNKNIATCFGACATSYDPIGFVQAYAGTDFIGAVTILAQELGIPLEERKQRTYTMAERQHHEQVKQQKLGMLDTLEVATAYYQHQLAQSEQARAYLASRGLSNEIISQFRLGFAPNSYSNLAAVFADYATNEVLVQCGLTKRSEQNNKLYDAMRNRITIPLLDSNTGKPIAFTSRLLANADNAPKYLNSPETELFIKGEQLYGFYQAKQHIRAANSVILVEGNLDVISLHLHGFTNAVASQGTAVTERQLEMLFKVCDNICVMFDSDAAGVKAAMRVLDIAIPLLTDIKQLNFIFLPGEEGKADPDSYLQAYGATVLRTYIAERSMSLSKVLVGRIKKECGGVLDDAESKTKFLVKLQPYLAQLNAPIMTAMLKQMIAQYLALDPAVVEAVLIGNKQVFSKGAALHGASKYTRSKAKAVVGKKVPSIYVRPLVILQRMLLANPKLARGYCFSEAASASLVGGASDGAVTMSGAPSVQVLGLIDYLANNCDEFADVNEAVVQASLGGDLHDTYGAAASGGACSVDMGSAAFTRLVDAVLALG